MTVSSIYRSSSQVNSDILTSTAPHPLPSPRSNEDSRKLPSLNLGRRSSSASTKIPSISTINVRNGHDTYDEISLPGLAALASAAEQFDSSNTLSDGMSFATVAPGGANNSNGTPAAPPICDNCGTSTTPLWRRSENNTILCNACGLFLKLHNRARPISLKTDVIKSRNRIRSSGQGQQLKKKSGPDTPSSGLAAAHPELSHPNQIPHTSYSRLPQNYPGPDGLNHVSRSETPTGYPPHPPSSHPSNIAPQHLFDGVTVDNSPSNPYHNTNSPSFAHGTLLHPSNLSAPPRNGSPSSASMLNGSANNNNNNNGVDHSESLIHQNNELKTRVSELEVINDLFRGRVAELEGNEAEARQALDDTLRRLQHATLRLEEMERREKEMITFTNGHVVESGERQTKRLRMSMSDLIEDPEPERDNVEGENVVEPPGPNVL